MCKLKVGNISLGLGHRPRGATAAFNHGSCFDTKTQCCCWHTIYLQGKAPSCVVVEILLSVQKWELSAKEKQKNSYFLGTWECVQRRNVPHDRRAKTVHCVLSPCSFLSHQLGNKNHSLSCDIAEPWWCVTFLLWVIHSMKKQTDTESRREIED